MLIENGRMRLAVLNLASCDRKQTRNFAVAVQTAREMGHAVVIQQDFISSYGVFIEAWADVDRTPSWRCTGHANYPCDTINNPFDMSCSRCEKPCDTYAEGKALEAALEESDDDDEVVTLEQQIRDERAQWKRGQDHDGVLAQ